MLSTRCCSAKMDVQHAMSCKRGGFATIRHNDLRDLAADLLSNVYKDVEIEPKLLPVTGENCSNRTANLLTEAIFDIRSRGFWVRGQEDYFNNATHKMRKRKRSSTTTGFYKLSTETSPRWYFQYTEV